MPPDTINPGIYINISKKAVQIRTADILKKFLKKGPDNTKLVCYIGVKQGRNGSPTYPIQTGGENMTVSEVIALLTLLAVVIFGVIDITKK